jgi:hypothetical protein
LRKVETQKLKKPIKRYPDSLLDDLKPPGGFVWHFMRLAEGELGDPLIKSFNKIQPIKN